MCSRSRPLNSVTFHRRGPARVAGRPLNSAATNILKAFSVEKKNTKDTYK